MNVIDEFLLSLNNIKNKTIRIDLREHGLAWGRGRYGDQIDLVITGILDRSLVHRFLDSMVNSLRAYSPCTHNGKLVHTAACGPFIDARMPSQSLRKDGYLCTDTFIASILDAFCDGGAANAPYLRFLLLPWGNDGKRLYQSFIDGDKVLRKYLACSEQEFKRWQARVRRSLVPRPCNESSEHLNQVYFQIEPGRYQLILPIPSSALLLETKRRIENCALTKENYATLRLPEVAADTTGFSYLSGCYTMANGGSNPQNLGLLGMQLGAVHMLPSLPPTASMTPLTPPINDYFYRDMLKREIKLFARIHQALTETRNNIMLRRSYRRHADGLMRAIFNRALKIQQMPGGWSRDSTYKALPKYQAYWLDAAFITSEDYRVENKRDKAKEYVAGMAAKTVMDTYVHLYKEEAVLLSGVTFDWLKICAGEYVL